MSRIDDNTFFADFNSLAGLKNQAQKDPNAALKDVAKQFESIFINMIFKNMRDANEAIGGGLFDSSQTKQYTEMMHSQMAQSMANSGGIGFADALIRQFEGKGSGLQGAAAQSDTDVLQRMALLDSGSANLVAKQAAERMAERVVKDAQQTTPTMKAADVAFQSPDSFVETLWPHAQQAGEKLGVDPRAILAQAALETGWGKYPMAKGDGSPSYNLFGIKADQRWSGERALVNTLEFRGGIAQQEKAAFRAYDSFAQSFDDYADFLQSSERYKDALMAGDNAAMFAAYLQKGGYATDPDYADKISNILSSKWFKALF
ncbi:flagellar assembly peptidoglycan hydrolase FlgJ [Marinomonas ostreistagni]|uniref:flagellar assembly peptidoglycan hydrolase FlgJ n=1 Tax=Marinomonas ostreistagni TaxID=359209 RepID=UPI00194DE8B8|nr:flagellar assembly peptidoglycan hydrolase FlgJ [Marinomonas ostreistagni]MBM6551138.1 flagellar assembly peptidoglycan hydrolase FlgJ [Marinomonas ostreistagni]